MERTTSSDSDDISLMLDSTLSSPPQCFVESPPTSSSASPPAYYPSQCSIHHDSSCDSDASPYRDSSCSRISDSTASSLPWRWSRRRGSDVAGWRRLELIREEEDRGDVFWNDGCSWTCQGMVWLMGIVTVFWVFCFFVWAAGRPFNTEVSVQSLTLGDFYTSEGVDWTGVPTRILSMNCSVTILVHNTATFFGIHVSATPVNLLYYDLVVASGQFPSYYQPRKTWEATTVEVEGIGVPLYGAGAGLEAAAFSTRGVPMRLNFTVQSRGDLVGKVIRTWRHRHVSCMMKIKFRESDTLKFREHSCTYS
ncbi:hypothetical protein Droror1_Dr00006068 [Drosera rotundifolia]